MRNNLLVFSIKLSTHQLKVFLKPKTQTISLVFTLYLFRVRKYCYDATGDDAQSILLTKAGDTLTQLANYVYLEI